MLYGQQTEVELHAGCNILAFPSLDHTNAGLQHAAEPAHVVSNHEVVQSIVRSCGPDVQLCVPTQRQMTRR